MLKPDYISQFPQFFSSPTVRDLANCGRSSFISSMIKESGYLDTIPQINFTYAELFESVFEILINKYRCEYVYKNAIASQLLLERHSLNQSSILSEFRAGRAKADIVILNGNSSVYEIKTELDNLERLHDQLSEYRKLFDRIFVVAHPLQIGRIEEIVDDDIGLVVLTNAFEIRTLREADSNRANVLPEVIFDSLRKAEYCQIIKNEFGYVPDVPNTLIHRECKTLFSELSPEVAHDRMAEVLRIRAHDERIYELVFSLPESLRMVCLDNKLSRKEWIRFQTVLDDRL